MTVVIAFTGHLFGLGCSPVKARLEKGLGGVRVISQETSAFNFYVQALRTILTGMAVLE
ncbi:MAG: hypothetical protein P8L32_03760 [Paracoccaceae bacterium]|nr:hypothetical protein [Paracoccaceae bacterium]